jgi:hypothetical protein
MISSTADVLVSELAALRNSSLRLKVWREAPAVSAGIAGSCSCGMLQQNVMTSYLSYPCCMCFRRVAEGMMSSILVCPKRLGG